MANRAKPATLGQGFCVRRTGLRRRGCRNQTGSMKTPKPSAGSGLVRRSGLPGPTPELLPASAPGRGKSRKDLPPDGPAEKALEGRVIKIRGAREHNLKNIDLTIPR